MSTPNDLFVALVESLLAGLPKCCGPYRWYYAAKNSGGDGGWWPIADEDCAQAATRRLEGSKGERLACDAHAYIGGGTPDVSPPKDDPVHGRFDWADLPHAASLRMVLVALAMQSSDGAAVVRALEAEKARRALGKDNGR